MSPADPVDTPVFAVLLRTPQFIVVDKPEGIASIPERFEQQRCVNKLLASQLGVRPFVVHRLDKEVSGALVFALDAASHRHLSMQFEQQRVHKTYTAVVHGSPPEDEGVVDSPIRQFGSGRMGVDTRRGKPCRTTFSVSERLGRCSVLHVHPATGRRHQIRVHLYSLGHPVVGDRRYGEAALQQQFPRLLLHASRIEFSAPDGAPVVVDSPLPGSFTALLERLRTHPSEMVADPYYES